MEDLDFAVENLPDSDSDPYRLDKRKARALRAKLAVTMAAHTDYGYDRAALYAKAAEDALYVIENTTALTDIDFSTLFDVESNNGPESILAIQCAVQGYSFGNAHNVAWSRSSVIADQTWGAGKGPTLSLQNMYERNDKRRMWTYMTNGDYYPMLNRAGGGYTYQYVSRDPSGDVLEDRNEMLAHIKKYIIGKSADCDGNVGINQDAANNIYLMRLADVYLTYVEAKMGTNNSTSDPTAMKYYNMVRQRAGISEASSVTFVELLKERRRELAFESQTVKVMQQLLNCSTAAMALILTVHPCSFPIMRNIPTSTRQTRITVIFIKSWIAKLMVPSMTRLSLANQRLPHLSLRQYPAVHPLFQALRWIIMVVQPSKL